MGTRRIVLLIVLSLLLPAGRLPGDGGVPLEIGPSVIELRRTAMASDWAAARRAMEQLLALGERGERVLADVVSTRLRQERVQIRQNLGQLGDRAAVLAAEQRLLELRAEAERNLRRLEADDTVGVARDHYRQLEEAYNVLRPAYGARVALIEVMARRQWMLEQVEASGGELSGVSFESEADLARQVRQALGMGANQRFALPRLGSDRAPPDERGRIFWLYCVGRQIDEFNLPLASWMDPLEQANARMVNQYREMLGILPLEYDPRLVQSARRHSREMVELRYFSHISPTPRNQRIGQRLANAGYTEGGGENIAFGQRSSDAAFWGWFDSAGHHLNMMDGQYSSIGVGRWNAVWAQNFGMGRRWMLSEEALPHAEVRGALVSPQDASTVETAPRLRRGRWMRN